MFLIKNMMFLIKNIMFLIRNINIFAKTLVKNIDVFDRQSKTFMFLIYPQCFCKNMSECMPPGYQTVGSDGRERVCRVEKPVYGMAQAGRRWQRCLFPWLVAAE